MLRQTREEDGILGPGVLSPAGNMKPGTHPDGYLYEQQ